MTGRRPLRLLSIAGSDPSGGAGIQADLKTFAAHDTYGMAVVTAVTAQSTTGVLEVETLSAELVERQIRAVLDDIGVDAIKIGMLGSAEVVARVARTLADTAGTAPVVLDPVLRASDGTPLIGPGGAERIARDLLPLVTVITPNRAEAEALLAAVGETRSRRGRDAETGESAVEAGARSLAAIGPAVLVTGGDAEGADVLDLLVDHAGSVQVFLSPRLATRSTHGTGCTLSAALAVRLAQGLALAEATRLAIDYVRRAMDPGLDLGRGRAPLDHGVGGGD